MLTVPHVPIVITSLLTLQTPHAEIRSTPVAIVQSVRVAPDSAGVLNAEFLQRWLSLHKALAALPAKVRDAAPVRTVDVRPDSTTVGIPPNLTLAGVQALLIPDFGVIAPQFPEVAAAFKTVDIRPTDYMPRATQVARVWFVASVRQIFSSSGIPLPEPDTTTARGRALAAVTARFDEFPKSGLGYNSAPPSDGTAPPPPFAEDTIGIGTQASAIAVDRWINANGALSAKGPVAFGDGHIYLLGFTALWCEGCPMTYAPLADMANKYARDGVRVLFTTSTGASAFADLTAYFDRHHVTLPVAVQTTPESMGSNATQFRVATLPVVVLIDQHGVIRHRWPGGSTDSAGFSAVLAKAVDGLLAESSGK